MNWYGSLLYFRNLVSKYTSMSTLSLDMHPVIMWRASSAKVLWRSCVLTDKNTIIHRTDRTIIFLICNNQHYFYEPSAVVCTVINSVPVSLTLISIFFKKIPYRWTIAHSGFSSKYSFSLVHFAPSAPRWLFWLVYLLHTHKPNQPR